MTEFVDSVSTEQSGAYRDGGYEVAPPWLRDQVGARYQYAKHIQIDAGLGDRVRWGMLQRFPEYAQPEALAHLGRDKRIFRGLTESDDSYAARLVSFKSTWKFAGNAPTLLRQLWALLGPNTVRIRYVVNGYTGAASESNQFADWWTIDETGLTKQRVSPSNWDWDSSYGKNVRFWIIIYRTDLTPAKWGVPPYEWSESGLFWGGAPGSQRDWLKDLRSVVRDFKAAGSHMGPHTHGYQGGLIVADPDAVTSPWDAGGPFDPELPPGYPMPDGDFETYANRPPGAIYISGL